jgi:hypothetical protein
MRKLITAVAAATAILIAGSIAWKAEATTTTGLSSLASLTESYSPVEKAACWCGPYRCACRRYWGPRYYGYYRRPYYRYRY